jgi:hypothetical protein
VWSERAKPLVHVRGFPQQRPLVCPPRLLASHVTAIQGFAEVLYRPANIGFSGSALTAHFHLRSSTWGPGPPVQAVLTHKDSDPESDWKRVANVSVREEIDHQSRQRGERRGREGREGERLVISYPWAVSGPWLQIVEQEMGEFTALFSATVHRYNSPLMC